MAIINNYSSDIVGLSPATSATLNYFKRKDIIVVGY